MTTNNNTNNNNDITNDDATEVSSPAATTATVLVSSTDVPVLVESVDNSIEQQDQNEQQQENIFICEYCKEQFISRNQMFKHLRNTINDMNANNSNTKNNNHRKKNKQNKKFKSISICPNLPIVVTTTTPIVATATAVANTDAEAGIVSTLQHDDDEQQEQPSSATTTTNTTNSNTTTTNNISIPLPPSMIKKQQRKIHNLQQKLLHTKYNKSTSYTNNHNNNYNNNNSMTNNTNTISNPTNIISNTTTSSTTNKGSNSNNHTKGSLLWIGNLPLVWTKQQNQYQRLRMLLRTHIPRSIPTPYIKLVCRKAYRLNNSNNHNETDINNNENDTNSIENSFVTTTNDMNDQTDDNDSMNDDNNEDQNEEDCDSINEFNTDRTDNCNSKDNIIQDTNHQQKQSSLPSSELHDHHQQQQNSIHKGPYVGYAIIMLRDDDECNTIINELHNRIITFDSVYTTKDEIQHNIDFYNIVHQNNNNNNNETNNNSDHNGTTFRIKVRPVDHHHTLPKTNVNNNSNNSRSDNMELVPTIQEQQQEHKISTNSNTHKIIPGQDPPLIDILRPLSTEILLDRIHRLGGDISTISATSDLLPSSSSLILPNIDPSKTMMDILQEQHDRALNCAVQAYTNTGVTPKFIYHEGKLIPDSLRDKLLHNLQNLRWAVPNHRSGMNTERYLVLLSNVQNDLFYNDLRILCKELMYYINPNFYYSGIAITKNFVASPHIDDRDQTYQYAISLGDFNMGGELCVDGGLQLIETETSSSESIDTTTNKQQTYVPVFHVVNTHNRIARVDGRHVHWVRTWDKTRPTTTGTSSCDRYSLIFYDTSQRQPTPIIDLTDPNFSVT